MYRYALTCWPATHTEVSKIELGGRTIGYATRVVQVYSSTAKLYIHSLGTGIKVLSEHFVHSILLRGGGGSTGRYPTSTAGRGSYPAESKGRECPC